MSAVTTANWKIRIVDDDVKVVRISEIVEYLNLRSCPVEEAAKHFGLGTNAVQQALWRRGYRQRSIVWALP